MTITELLKSDAIINVTIKIQDLQAWHKEVIEDTRRKLEEVVLSDKAETYPSPKQVSEILGVDLVTLWRWGKKGYLVPNEVGGKRRYKMSDVKKLLNNKR